MDPATLKMEEIYAIPVKYIESWLELKDSKGFIEYWVVLKTHYMFFFKNQNTHCKDQLVGYINIEVGEANCTSKKGSKDGKCDFLLETSKKKFLFRAAHDILRKRWIYAIDLVSNAEPPEPLPGDLDFKERTVFTPSPGKMKPRAHSIAVIHCEPNITGNFTPDMNKNHQSKTPNTLPLNISAPSNVTEDEVEPYDPVFIPPSWYFRNVTRNDAMKLLQSERAGTYLLRNAETSSNEDHYTLSIKDLNRVKHHKIFLIPGACYFDGAPNAPFPNPTDAVSYLMKTKYVSLQPRPLPNSEVRHSGDGQEDHIMSKTNFEGSSLCSPVTPTFGGNIEMYRTDDTMARKSSGLLPSPPGATSFTDGNIPSPPDLPSIASRQPLVDRPTSKGGSLPAHFRMKDRPLPETPIYENSAVIRSHLHDIDGPYVQMNRSFDNDDAPPPLPRKKSSKRRNNNLSYVNMNEHPENQNLSDEYERPIDLIQNEEWRKSLP